MAAALLRHALDAEPEPLHSLRVMSAGVSALKGYPPSPNAVEALRKVGLALADHRSQPVTPELLDAAIAVYCMTDAHRAMMELQFDHSAERTHLMREFLDHNERDIPDPFGMNLAAYEASRDSMVEAIPSLFVHLRSLLNVPSA